MKYDSLSSRQRDKLRKLYEIRYPKPSAEDLPEYIDPPTTPSKIVPVGGSIRLFVEPSNVVKVAPPMRNNSRFGSSSGFSNTECLAKLTIVQGADTQTLEIRTDELGDLIDELTRCRDEIMAINERRLERTQAEKRQRDDLKEWEKNRDQYIESRTNKHKPTETQIESAETLAHLFPG